MFVGFQTNINEMIPLWKAEIKTKKSVMKKK
jgi:hypothetical protein